MHGVSVVTASRAIQVLRDKGLIRTVDRSGSFVTPAVAADSGERYALLQRSTPGPGFQASMAFMQAGFAAIRRQEGIEIDVDRFHYDEGTPRPTSGGRPGTRPKPAYPGSSSCPRATRTRPPGRTRPSSGRAARWGSPSC